MFTKEELLNFYYDADVFLAPSYGEGFGLPAFDAIGTGMPTIMTKDVFPHEQYVNPRWGVVKSTQIDSLWPETHPGKMLKPDFDDLVEKMRYVADNYDSVSTEAFDFAGKAHKEASWEARTKKVFDDLAVRINQ